MHQNHHPVVIISDNPSLGKGKCEYQINIQDTGPLTALVAITPLQLIAYELSLLRGLNPDAPRNVAKVYVCVCYCTFYNCTIDCQGLVNRRSLSNIALNS